MWANNRVMRDEEWKPYLMSQEFREIMWSPIVLGELICGIRKYCWRKEKIKREERRRIGRLVIIFICF